MLAKKKELTIVSLCIHNDVAYVSSKYNSAWVICHTTMAINALENQVMTSLSTVKKRCAAQD